MVKHRRKKGDLFIGTLRSMNGRVWYWGLYRYHNKTHDELLVRGQRKYTSRSLAIREARKMFIHILNKQIEGMAL